MDSINTSFKRPALTLLRRTGGFTLVEVGIAGAVGALMLAGVLTSYILSVRGFNAIANYWQIHVDGRYAVDRFAADMRGVSAITSFSTNGSLVVKIPTSFSYTGTIISTKTITYSYASGALNRTDSSTGRTTQLATNIYRLTFSLFDKLGNPTTVIPESKGIQLDIKLRKYTAGKVQSEDYLSARLDMRNKP